MCSKEVQKHAIHVSAKLSAGAHGPSQSRVVAIQCSRMHHLWGITLELAGRKPSWLFCLGHTKKYGSLDELKRALTLEWAKRTPARCMQLVRRQAWCYHQGQSWPYWIQKNYFHNLDVPELLTVISNTNIEKKKSYNLWRFQQVAHEWGTMYILRSIPLFLS